MEKIAIIGTGIAGMGCGYHLHQTADLTFFEKNDYTGGHTNTIAVDEQGKQVYMDTGFMVFNFQTYPRLCQLFREINAPIKKTDMSFSVQHKPSGLEYCGSGLNGLFAQRKKLFSLSHIRMLSEINRFNKESIKIVDDQAYIDYSLKRYIREFKFSEDMLWKYLVPMSSAVWSTPMKKMLDFPAVTLIRFFKNHGFLGLNTQHQWYTLENGSQSYRELLIQPFKNKIRLNTGVLKVKREKNGVLVTTSDQKEHVFDKVIFAAHADQTLHMLEDADLNEKRILSAFSYQTNVATVHTDESVMPKLKSVWSSWNYSIGKQNGEDTPTTIYWMNRLQQVSDRKNYFVSINAIPGSIDQKKIIRIIEYEHPLFDVAAIQAQRELYKLNEKGPVYFCGSYFNYGFHEDAYASAVDLCEHIKQTMQVSAKQEQQVPVS